MPKEEEENSYTQLRNQLNASLERNYHLESENEQLKQELQQLKSQISSLQAQVEEKKSTLWKKSQSSTISHSSSPEKQLVDRNSAEGSWAVENSSKFKANFTASIERLPRVPNPPPRPKYFHSTPNLIPKEKLFPPPPPPLPPPRPLQSQGTLFNAVRRVPEVLELYRSLTRKNGKPNTRTAKVGSSGLTTSREMIGEIENRSAYLIAVKSDVLTQGEFINFLSSEVENAAYKEISDVEFFVKWLDDELSYLVDERAVLKNFSNWPEKKADAMREAAFNYRDLKHLVSEISTFQDTNNQPTATSLRVMKALQEKLESSVHNLEKVRDSMSKRYRDFKIPWQWMNNSGIIAQLKLGSLHLAKVYMRRVVTALQSDTWHEEQGLLLQGVQFAFRVHQFVGGFNEECRIVFQELQKLANSFWTLSYNKKNDLSELS